MPASSSAAAICTQSNLLLPRIMAETHWTAPVPSCGQFCTTNSTLYIIGSDNLPVYTTTCLFLHVAHQCEARI